MSAGDYVLGYAERERDRLDLQGRLYADITRRAFVDAGIEPGMRVLDVGCGSGDVSRLAAGIIGPAGSVLGIDRDGATVDRAAAAAREAGPGNVEFTTAEIGEPIPGAPFDAAVGRFVLMHQPDPVETLVAVMRVVRPGGIVAFVESYMAGLLDARHSSPWSPLYDRVVRWKCDVVSAAGADIEIGLKLRALFAQAGLRDASLRFEAPTAGGPESVAARYMIETVRSMAPMAERHGIAGIECEDLGALEADLHLELTSTDATVLVWPAVAAWGRTP